MATLAEDVTRLQADVQNLITFKGQVQAYVAAHQANPAVDTTALEAALSDLESNISSAGAGIPVDSAASAPTPATPAS